MNISLLLYILAVVCWTLGAFNVPRANWTCAGLAFAGAATWLV